MSGHVGLVVLPRIVFQEGQVTALVARRAIQRRLDLCIVGLLVTWSDPVMTQGKEVVIVGKLPPQVPTVITRLGVNDAHQEMAMPDLSMLV